MTLPPLERSPLLAFDAYIGRRTRGEARVYVQEDAHVYALPHRAGLSPNGIEWSAPLGRKDLARSLLLHAGGEEPDPALLREFERRIVARLPLDGFVLPKYAVRGWLRSYLSDAA